MSKQYRYSLGRGSPFYYVGVNSKASSFRVVYTRGMLAPVGKGCENTRLLCYLPVKVNGAVKETGDAREYEAWIFV